MKNDAITKKLAHFKKTRLCILQDDASVGARAVLVSPANSITTEITNTMIGLSRGLVFVAISTDRAERLLLEPMTIDTQNTRYPTGLISVDAREGISTGISAPDRAKAIQILGAEIPNPRELVKPGHIFPVAVRRGGVLVRNALPEGACDLATLTGQTDAAVFMDLLSPAGTLLSNQEQCELAEKEQIPIILLSEIVQHRLQNEPLVYKVAEAALPTRSSGELRSIVYRSHLYEGEHFALTKGVISANTETLTRVQTENTFSDVFGGQGITSRINIRKALELIDHSNSGVFVYLRRSLRGALAAELLGCKDNALTPNFHMMRSYGLGAQILRDLGVRKIRLVSNTQQQLIGLNTFGLEIVGQQALNPDKE